MDPANPNPAPVTPSAPAAPAPASPAVSPSATPSAAPAPETVSVSRSDLERFQRYEQQVQGHAPFRQVLSELGVRDADELRTMVNPYLTARQSGINLNSVLGAITRQPTQASGAAQTQATGTTPAPAALTEERLLQILERENAVKDHDVAMRDQDQFQTSLVSELAGANATPELRTAVEALVERELASAMENYPENHALRGKAFAPVTRAEKRAEIRANVQKVLSAVRGAHLAELGRAAAAAPAPNGAGAVPPGPGITGPASNGPDRDAMIAETRARMAARMGAPVSAG